jgi:hypothetical protein
VLHDHNEPFQTTERLGESWVALTTGLKHVSSSGNTDKLIMWQMR